jgi:hypothetical protein
MTPLISVMAESCPVWTKIQSSSAPITAHQIQQFHQKCPFAALLKRHYSTGAPNGSQLHNELRSPDHPPNNGYHHSAIHEQLSNEKKMNGCPMHAALNGASESKQNGINYSKYFDESLEQLKKEGRYREFKTMTRRFITRQSTIFQIFQKRG